VLDLEEVFGACSHVPTHQGSPGRTL